MHAQNLEKLSDDARALIAYAFKNVTVGWDLCYMLEVKLDDPINHILKGGDGLKLHGGNGSPHYAQHVGDADWAVVHFESPEWLTIQPDELIPRAEQFLAASC